MVDAFMQVCNVAPVPGETKVWQYITLFRRIFLIDCPGVVYSSNDSETDILLKGVVWDRIWFLCRSTRNHDMQYSTDSSGLLQLLPFSCMSEYLECFDSCGPFQQVRIENVKNPDDHVGAVLERAKKDHIQKTYDIEHWEDANDFLEQLARKVRQSASRNLLRNRFRPVAYQCIGYVFRSYQSAMKRFTVGICNGGSISYLPFNSTASF